MQKSEASTWKIPWKGIIIAFICSAVALVLVFSKVAKPADVLRELESYPLGYFFGALFFVLAAWIVDGQRIGMLTRAVDHPVPWWQLTVVLGAANFLTLVTPFAGGGGALIIYFLYRRGVSVPTATAVVTAGGIAGQIGLAVLALVMFSTVSNVPVGLARYLTIIRFGAVGYIVVLIGLLFVIVQNERWLLWLSKKRGTESKGAAWLEEFRATYRLILEQRVGYYLACLVVALAYYIVYYLGGFVLLTGFGAYEPWFRFAVSVLFGIAPVFSPIPGGAGASELIAFLVLENVLPGDSLGTFILLWRTVVFYLPIVIGGSVFTFLLFRWAATPNLAKKPMENPTSTVILPEENDHNR